METVSTRHVPHLTRLIKCSNHNVQKICHNNMSMPLIFAVAHRGHFGGMSLNIVVEERLQSLQLS